MNDNTPKQKCGKLSWRGDFARHATACSNTAKVERDGKWFCGVHDPAKGQAKREAWVKKNTARNVMHDAQDKVRAAERMALDAFITERPNDARVRSVLNARAELDAAEKAYEVLK